MRYLLDTNICIYLIKQKPQTVLERFRQTEVGDIGISSITVFELEYGIAKSAKPQQNQQALTQFLLPLEVLPFDASDAQIAGLLRVQLEKQGKPIGPFDLLIGAQALQNNLILVSNHTREFERIPNLQLENWAEPQP